MKKRFEGDNGKRLLIEALKGNDLVGRDEALAKRFAEEGELVSLQHGSTFIEQEQTDNDIYFII